ncbi:DMT family protein [Tumidithrix elongata RA019]|uniref:DMT family protein n=1 Tax=Tumidithrix elongata BACA0141 TaxID=2716417 RepID=A0AAW9Q451_9CYAN|nr:DMT family protein [Tumidithrix elongata RA019]
MLTVILLVFSNIFMTLAWYGHLKFLQNQSIFVVILASWGIAFFEYCFQVPANRIGYGEFTATQLKIIQEAISILAFVVFFAVMVLGESLKWNHIVAFALMLIAVFFAVGVK